MPTLNSMNNIINNDKRLNTFCMGSTLKTNITTILYTAQNRRGQLLSLFFRLSTDAVVTLNLDGNSYRFTMNQDNLTIIFNNINYNTLNAIGTTSASAVSIVYLNESKKYVSQNVSDYTVFSMQNATGTQIGTNSLILGDLSFKNSIDIRVSNGATTGAYGFVVTYVP